MVIYSFSEPSTPIFPAQNADSSDKEARGESGATDQIREQAIENVEP